MMRFPFYPLFLLLSLLAPPAGRAEESGILTRDFEPIDGSRDRTVPVRVYLPKVTAPQPVVIFSHGLGGSRENSKYLGEHWASHGYVAVFVQHHGSDESVWKDAAPGERFAKLKEAASVKSAVDRYLDIPFVIDRLTAWNAEEGHALAGRLDLEHIGLCGHSFGAVTTQALMGQKFPVPREFGDPRIDAFFAMSPSSSAGFAADKAFGHISAPVLCMTGTKDSSPITPATTPESRREVYTALPSGDKYELVFDGGTHSAFSDTGFRNETRQPHHHPAIQMISTRFWDAYLRGDAAAKTWLQSEKPRSDASLASGDIWRWK